MSTHSFSDIVRPANVTHCVVTRVSKNVDIPKPFVFHVHIVPRNVHGHKYEQALAGYASEHDELEDLGWERFEWKANGGYGNQGKKPGSRGKANAAREVIWFSPYCIKPGDGSVQLSILDGLL